MRWWSAAESPTHVAVDDHERRRLIREAEYQQSLDSQSKVLRISGGGNAGAGAGSGAERRVVAGVIVRVAGEEL